MNPDVVELIGNPRAGSRTRALADAATTAIVGSLDRAGIGLTGHVVLELADAVGVSFGPEPAYGSRALGDAHGQVRSARLLVVATPTYKGSYTGLLKVFLDQYGHRELAGAVAVPIAIAAQETHRAAVGHALCTLLSELGATVPAPALAALEQDLSDVDEVVDGWLARNGDALVAAFRSPSAPS
jgi:FMN reductase